MSIRRRVADKQHRWLSQVDLSGVVLSEPVLAEAAPAGFRKLEKRELAQFYKAREVWNLPRGMVQGDVDAQWIDFVLDQLLRLGSKYWQVGAAIESRYVVTLSQQRETLRPTRVLRDGTIATLLFVRVPRAQSLETPWNTGGSWKASPTTKVERLLRETGVEVGLVTNGEAWRLIVASPSETASWVTWTAQTWADSPSTLAAFMDLLGEARFFAGPRSGTILELVRSSRKRQADVADQLGAQVREALEVFVREIDRLDAATGGVLLHGYADDEVFEAAAALLMRMVFLLKAEESGLLPHGSVAYDRSYGVLYLLTRLEREHRLAPEKLDHSTEAYAQLLGTFRLVHDGSPDSDINVAAYAGDLFDSNKYPLLEGRARNGAWVDARLAPLPVKDAVVRAMLRRLKYARGDNGAVQWVSYRTLEIEQLGHMYEGLLECSVRRAPKDRRVMLLAATSKSAMPEMPEPLNAGDTDSLALEIARHSGRSEAAVRRALGDTEAPREAMASVPDALLRLDGLVRCGGAYVGFGLGRREQGAHYTPPHLTEPIVRDSIETVLPAAERAAPARLLALAICDPAMGSGAFLVQVVRVLGDWLADAWDALSARTDAPLAAPLGSEAVGQPDEVLMPATREERVLLARRFVAERCVYGVDRSALAVEMAKLSLWLVTAANDRPFSFLDHALVRGDSLLGLERDQLLTLSTGRSVSEQPLLAYAFRERLEKAIAVRHGIEAIPVANASAVRGKKTRLAEANAFLREAMVVGTSLLRAHLSPRGRSANGSTDDLIDGELRSCLHWALAFPEVFFGRQGFDVVLGNPPWGSKLSSMEKRWIDIGFSIVGDYESAYAFFERSCALVRPSGHVALVLPNTVLRNDSAGRLRAHIAKTLDLSRVVDLSEGEVFRGASVRCCVIHVNRTLPTEDPVMWFRATANTEDLRAIPMKFIPKKRLIGSGAWTNLSAQTEDSDVIVSSASRPCLGEFFEAKQGYIPYRKSTLIARFGEVEGTRICEDRAFHANEKLDADYVRELQGGDVRALDVTWSGTWVRYGRWVSSYIDPAYFSGPRVLVREIVGKAPYFVIAAQIDGEYVHNPSIIVLKPKKGMERIVPLVAVYLNSRVAGEWLRANGSKADKGLFPKVLVKDLRLLPFVPLSACSAELVDAARAIIERAPKAVDRSAIDELAERLLGSEE